MRSLWIVPFALILAGCGGETSTENSGQTSTAATEAKHFDLFGTFNDRAAFRGHEPFAGIVYNPAYSTDSFVLRFYNYWTGVEDEGTAQRHVLVRRTRAFDVQNGEFVLLDRAMEQWADSRTCPAILESMESFPAALPSVAPDQEAQSWESPPYSSKEVEESAAMDSPLGHCDCLDVWANLQDNPEPGGIGYSLDIKTGGHLAESELGRWTSHLLTTAETCFSRTPPELPIGPAQ